MQVLVYFINLPIELVTLLKEKGWLESLKVLDLYPEID